jgi:hypothetical protein
VAASLSEYYRVPTLLGGLINISYSLVFVGSCFGATEPEPVGLLFRRRRQPSRGAKPTSVPMSALLEADQMSLTMSMPRSRRSIKSCILLAPAISGCMCLALLTQATSARSDASPTLNTMSYLPSISDFMIATIQPRHVRLWVAARSGDWSFAAYELGNLKGAFDRLGRAHPVEHEIPLQEMISSVTSQPFEDMHKAIESKDKVAFSKAYGDLTSACNACHEATTHGVVVIRVPTDTSISDQDFERTAP